MVDPREEASRSQGIQASKQGLATCWEQQVMLAKGLFICDGGEKVPESPREQGLDLSGFKGVLQR